MHEDEVSKACQDASSYGNKEACPSCMDVAFPFPEDNVHFFNRMRVFIAFNDYSFAAYNNGLIKPNQTFLLQVHYRLTFYFSNHLMLFIYQLYFDLLLFIKI